MRYLCALRDLKRPELETLLLSYLEHPLDEVVEAASDALATCGGTSAVAPLREAVVRRSLSKRARAAVDIAIELIQARAEGGGPGELSLVEATEEGRLSPATEGGELSEP